MRKWQIILVLVLVMAIPSLAISAEICPICNMDASKSQTKYVLTTEDGKKIPFCSLRCAFIHTFVKNNASFLTTQIGSDKLNDAKGNCLGTLRTVDFESKKMFNALKGYYVVGSDVIPKMSMEPYSLGFSTLMRANRFWEKHDKPGVRVVNFESATHDVVDLLRADGTIPPTWVYPGVSGKEAPKEQIDITIEEKGMIKEEKKEEKK